MKTGLWEGAESRRALQSHASAAAVWTECWPARQRCDSQQIYVRLNAKGKRQQPGDPVS